LIYITTGNRPDLDEDLVREDLWHHATSLGPCGADYMKRLGPGCLVHARNRPSPSNFTCIPNSTNPCLCGNKTTAWRTVSDLFKFAAELQRLRENTRVRKSSRNNASYRRRFNQSRFSTQNIIVGDEHSVPESISRATPTGPASIHWPLVLDPLCHPCASGTRTLLR